MTSHRGVQQLSFLVTVTAGSFELLCFGNQKCLSKSCSRGPYSLFPRKGWILQGVGSLTDKGCLLPFSVFCWIQKFKLPSNLLWKNKGKVFQMLVQYCIVTSLLKPPQMHSRIGNTTRETQSYIKHWPNKWVVLVP